MKKVFSKKLFWAFIVLMMIFVEACNRGIGCPSDF